MKFTIDLPKRYPNFCKTDFTDFTTVRNTDMVFAYIKNAYRMELLPFFLPLNFSTSPDLWGNELTQFSERCSRNELDVLLYEKNPVGLILRNHEDSLLLLQGLNNLPTT